MADGGRVRWANVMSPEFITAIKTRDQRDAERYSNISENWLEAVRRRTHGDWAKALFIIRYWLKL